MPVAIANFLKWIDFGLIWFDQTEIGNTRLIYKGVGIKLKPEFLQTLKVPEKQFASLISNTTIGSRFVDFLNE